MANKLQKLIINRADLVDSPSNPLARVMLFKRAVVAKDMFGAQTTDGVLSVDVFWDTYYNLLSAFRTSVDSIIFDSSIDDKKRVSMLKTSVSEVSDKLNALFDTYPVNKQAEDQNEDLYAIFEKTVDVLTELDTLILSGEISANEVSDILEGLEMAEKAKDSTETVETLKTAITAKDAEITKAQADIETLKAEITTLKAEKVEKAAPEVVDIWKGVNPEIKAQFEVLKKQSEESAKIAKAAEENAAMVKLTKRVGDELKAISGTVDEKASILRDVEKMLPADKFEKLYNTLKDASVAIEKSELLVEKGQNGNVKTGSSAFEKLKAKATELISKKEAKTEAEGIALAAKQNPDLYKEYMAEDEN